MDQDKIELDDNDHDLFSFGDEKMNAPTVKELWRFPVKSFSGEKLDSAVFQADGLLGDRSFALIEVDTQRVVSAKNSEKYSDLLDCQAEFVRPPQASEELPPVRITLPNGTQSRSDAADVHHLLSSYFGVDLRLATVAPSDFTADQYHPDIDGADPSGHRDTTVDVKLGSALFEEMGAESAVPVGSFKDAYPLSVMTSSTLKRIRELSPGSEVDVRRFRMNMIVNSNERGFVENDWVGRSLSVGSSVHIQITENDPRCVMITLAQRGLPQDVSIMEALVQYNRIELEGGLYPCAGVYASIASPGLVRVGDMLEVS